MTNEKDRFGENFDERANEDSYFAQKDHELIGEMKAEFQKIEAARLEAEKGRCPKCSEKFEKYNFMGFILDRCGCCEGIWLKKGELAAILRQQSRGPLGAFFDRCFAKVDVEKKS